MAPPAISTAPLLQSTTLSVPPAASSLPDHDDDSPPDRSAATEPVSAARNRPSAAQCTQTPNRLHHQFTRFTRGQQSLDDLASLTLPTRGRRRSWQHAQRLSDSHHHDSGRTITDIHEYLAILQQLRRADRAAQPQNAHIVAGFQSLAQELSLVIQERELHGGTGQHSPHSQLRSTEPTLKRSISVERAAEARADERLGGGTDSFPQHAASAARSIETDIHQCDWPELQARLKTDLKLGLSAAEVSKRQLEIGVNLITPPPSPSMIWMFTKELFSGFGPILWAAAVLAVIAWRVGDPPIPSISVS